MSDAFRLTEAERKLANTVLKGTVAAVDPATVRIRVRSGGRLSGWIPWATPFAGAGVRVWNCPSVGEQVTVLAPSGNAAQGVAVGALFSAANPPPSTDPNVTAIRWQDGTSLTYDRAAHAFALAVPGGGTIALSVGGMSLTLSDTGVAIVGDVTVSGSITASGTIIDAGGNTNHHSH